MANKASKGRDAGRGGRHIPAANHSPNSTGMLPDPSDIGEVPDNNQYGGRSYQHGLMIPGGHTQADANVPESRGAFV